MKIINKHAHLNMLKYSFERIENTEDHDKKFNFLNDIKENEKYHD